MTHLSYRADVDGLRAVAVSAVVLFHAFPQSALSGGFTGVDVFFVISGYLITRIIAAELTEGTFSLGSFYARRIKRIVPALTVVLVASLVAGWFLLLPGDYAVLGESAIAAMLSVSNVYFFRHTGYFDAEAQSMPLLHTWSLGVEEQFYFVWPLALIGLFWLSRKFRVRLLTLALPILVVAFCYSVWLVTSDGKAAFYLSTSRAYELLIGAVVALAVLPGVLSRRAGLMSAMSVVGAGLIVCGFLVLDEQQAFPGWAGLLPTLGAALIILAGQGSVAGIVSRMLATKPFVALGRISYSLYLWHWPVLVFFSHYANGPPSTLEAAALVALSVGLAALSYRFVEQPMRASRAGNGIQFARFAGAAGMISALGAAVVFTNGAIGRIPDAARDVASLDTMWKWRCPEQAAVQGLNGERKFCFLGAPRATAAQHAVLWGDSQAEHFAPLLDVVGREIGLSIMLYRNCPAVIDGIRYFRHRAQAPHYSTRCGNKRAAMLNWLKSNRVIVILASQWMGVEQELADRRQSRGDQSSSVLLDALRSTVADIDGDRHRIFLLGQIPLDATSKVICAQRTMAALVTRDCGNFRESKAAEVLNRLIPSETILRTMSTDERITFIPVAPRLCTGDVCATVFNGEYIYRDNRHLRRNLKDETKRELAARIGFYEALRQVVTTQR